MTAQKVMKGLRIARVRRNRDRREPFVLVDVGLSLSPESELLQAEFLQTEDPRTLTLKAIPTFGCFHDLAGYLCLSKGAARRALWKKTVEELQKLGVEESRIKSILRTDAPEELAEFAESLRQRGELLHREC